MAMGSRPEAVDRRVGSRRGDRAMSALPQIDVNIVCGLAQIERVGAAAVPDGLNAILERFKRVGGVTRRMVGVCAIEML